MTGQEDDEDYLPLNDGAPAEDGVAAEAAGHSETEMPSNAWDY